MIEYLLVILYLWLSFAMYKTITRAADYGSTVALSLSKKQRIFLGVIWPITLISEMRKRK